MFHGLWKSFLSLSLGVASIIWAAAGGFMGLILMWLTSVSGWWATSIGAAVGLYVAMFIAYHNVSVERDGLRAKRQDNDFANVLSGIRQKAVHDIRNRLINSDDDFNTRQRSEQELVETVVATMRTHGCDDYEISAFHDFTDSEIREEAKTITTYTFPVNQFLGMVELRLKRLAVIIDNHAEHKVFRQ